MELIRLEKLIVWDECPIAHKHDVETWRGRKVHTRHYETRQCQIGTLTQRENNNIGCWLPPSAIGGQTRHNCNNDGRMSKKIKYMGICPPLATEHQHASPKITKRSSKRTTRVCWLPSAKGRIDSSWTRRRHDPRTRWPMFANKSLDDLNNHVYGELTPKWWIGIQVNNIKIWGRFYCNSEQEGLYPIEYPNLLTPLDIPPHELKVKLNCPVMMLRNTNGNKGQANGTRMIMKHLCHMLLIAKPSLATTSKARIFIQELHQFLWNWICLLNQKDNNFPSEQPLQW